MQRDRKGGFAWQYNTVSIVRAGTLVQKIQEHLEYGADVCVCTVPGQKVAV